MTDFDVGGAAHVAASILRTVHRDRFEVAAVSLCGPSGSTIESGLAQQDIPVRYLGRQTPFFGGFDPRLMARATRAIARFRPHVIHTHTFALQFALPYALWRRLGIIHTVHNMAEKETESRIDRLVRRVTFRRRVLPVAIAEQVRASMRRLYRIDAPPLVRNGIPVDAVRRPTVERATWRSTLGFSDTDVLFVCLAELRAQKNHALLLQAFDRGPGTDPRAHLLLVGDGVLRPDIELAVRALRSRSRVHLLGLRVDIPDVLHAADTLVMSSDWEGSPLSVMEAMAAGNPVICTAVGGVSELVEHDRCGLLVPPGDARALAEAMTRLLDRPELRMSMGAVAARRAARRFDVTVMARAYETLYATTAARWCGS